MKIRRAIARALKWVVLSVPYIRESAFGKAFIDTSERKRTLVLLSHDELSFMEAIVKGQMAIAYGEEYGYDVRLKQLIHNHRTNIQKLIARNGGPDSFVEPLLDRIQQAHDLVCTEHNSLASRVPEFVS